jgi:hypothetical protein
MTALHTTFSERRTLRSGLAEHEPSVRQLGFALQLFDAFTRKNFLAGGYEDDASEQEDQSYADRTGDGRRLAEHTTVRMAGRALLPFQKRAAGTYLFFADLPPASYIVEMRSPYYQPLDVTVTLPMATLAWPAFPDVTLANENLPLDSPSQPAAYRAQRTAATAIPSTRYPFPQDATLVRGTIRSGGVPIAGATVSRVGDPRVYATDAIGDYVLFLTDIPGVGATVTIRVTHPLHAVVNAPVQALRGMTVLLDVTLV